MTGICVNYKYGYGLKNSYKQKVTFASLKLKK